MSPLWTSFPIPPAVPSFIIKDGLYFSIASVVSIDEFIIPTSDCAIITDFPCILPS